MRRILDHNGVTASVFETHPDGFAVRNFQDVEPVIEQNKALQLEGDGYTPSRDLRRRASIPLVVWERWDTEMRMMGILHDKQAKTKYLNKKLADPENRHFLTHGPTRFKVYT